MDEQGTSQAVQAAELPSALGAPPDAGNAAARAAQREQQIDKPA
jgi:hypothetical protein